jgi:hypothetical protein
VKFPTDELLHVYVYELKLSSQQQNEAIESLFRSPNELYLFATPEEILKGYTQDGKVILSHTKKLLNK